MEKHPAARGYCNATRHSIVAVAAAKKGVASDRQKKIVERKRERWNRTNEKCRREFKERLAEAMEARKKGEATEEHKQVIAKHRQRLERENASRKHRQRVTTQSM